MHDHSDGNSPNQPVEIMISGGGLFNLYSLDISEWDSSFPLGQTLTVTGHLFGGGTVVTNINTDNIFGFDTII